MRVRLDNSGHYLVSDQYCFWVAKEVAGTKAKKAYDKIVSGYYGKPLDAIQDYIERSFRSSEANEIVELMEEVKLLKETVAEWKVTLERGKE